MEDEQDDRGLNIKMTVKELEIVIDALYGDLPIGNPEVSKVSDRLCRFYHRHMKLTEGYGVKR